MFFAVNPRPRHCAAGVSEESRSNQHEACLSPFVEITLFPIASWIGRFRTAKPNGPIRPRVFGLFALLLAILHGTLALSALDEKSPTFDEPSHLTSGYSYWVKNDYRLGPENGLLPQRWAALPLLMSRPRFVPAEAASWQRGMEGRAATEFFYHLGNDPEQMLQQGRVMMAMVGAALCLLIYRCSRDLFGAIGGLLSEMMAVLDPTLLAHTALVTSDVMAAFFFTAAIWTVWQMLIRFTPGRIAWACLSVSGLFLAKLSALMFLPMLALLCAIRLCSRDPIKVSFGNRTASISNKWHKAFLMGCVCALLCAVVMLSIWAAFGFRFSAVFEDGNSRQTADAQWEYNITPESSFDHALVWSRNHRLLPEAYLLGLACVHKHSAGRPAFLDGEWSVVGFRSFFPRAFLYKTTVALMGLIILGGAAAVMRWRRRSLADPSSTAALIRRDLVRLTPFWILMLVYGGFALASSLNIGVRHLLPIYPSLFIVCGAGAFLLQGSRVKMGTLAVGLVFVCQLAESFAVRPDYLCYFNQLAGGSQNGYRHLVDSSYDWGQDLPGLKQWLAANVPPAARSRVYLGYFGSADPGWYGIEARRVPWDAAERESLTPLTGGIYCISATTLQQVYSHAMGPWSGPYEGVYQRLLASTTDSRTGGFRKILDEQKRNDIDALKELRFARLCAYLRHSEPVARVGHSILIFAVTSAEIEHALYGPPAELSPDISVLRE
jgi:hypothetical protein